MYYKSISEGPGKRVASPLETNNPDAVGENAAVCLRVERTRVPIGRSQTATLEKVTLSRRHHDADAPRQSHAAFTAAQALAGHVYRDQRGRTESLNGDTRPTQVELVGDHCGQRILVVAEDRLQHVDGLAHFRIGVQPKQVSAQVRSGKDTD